MAMLTKFIDPLSIPAPLAAHHHVGGYQHFSLRAEQFGQKLHSELPNDTQVWGFNGSFPGPLLEVRAGHPVVVDWHNQLPPTHLIQPIVIGMPGPAPGPLPVRMSMHLHGGHTPPDSDGHPLDWVAPGRVRRDYYPNGQRGTTLWYHDHAMDVTRFNVYAGLAGFYLIRDPGVEAPLNLPRGAHEIPLVIQDRMFEDDGRLRYQVSMDQPEFFGDTALVNGRVWPCLEVDPRKYRFRILNGSNARFYRLSMSDGGTFHMIGSDGGFLSRRVPLPSILLGPAERADVIVDFTGMAAGTEIKLVNTAQAPFPGDGGPTDLPDVMLFRVKAGPVQDTSSLPDDLVAVAPIDATDARTREIVLSEEMMNGMHTTLLNHMGFMDPITEAPVIGTTEYWDLINTTGDSHPIHLHLIQFQLVGRQDLQKLDPQTGQPDPVTGLSIDPVTGRFLYDRDTARFTPPGPEEAGWKDTIHAPPGMVTRIVAHFHGYTGRYVWHCHILEHEERDMMRPLIVLPPQLGNGMPHF